MSSGPTEPVSCRQDGAAQQRILEAVRRYWGFSSLLPLQEPAIRAGLEHRDSLVVLPTGGGKSLCYQVPPLLANRMDLVVSPLISLMKDQVDGLRACGYPAAALHGGMSAEKRRQTQNDLVAGKYRVVFVAPERLMTDGFLSMVSRLKVRAFAIDEAHCISHWGHDFRKEYRRLSELKQRFPQASIHAYTATATQRVREDIIAQLSLVNPAVLLGCFDRPNLIYRIIPRVDLYGQVLEVLGRHRREATIIYCISRKDTEGLAEFLKSQKINAAHYHAGMEPDNRRRTQDAFSSEKIDVIVATVAFGMGIDRSNVRSVIHAAMPKSIEHYQQETGRAGRDGLEAECVLFYSYADVSKWTSLLTRSAQEANCPTEILDAQLSLLEHLRQYCRPDDCRHRHLSEYFGQSYAKENCQACDVCLGESAETSDASVPAQKILSCVARVDERFGVSHIVNILRGGDTEMIRKWNHQRLSTYGLMKGTPRKTLVSMVQELLDQSLLERTKDEYQTLRLNDASWEVMRGRRKVRMRALAERTTRRSEKQEAGWIGVDRGLFESLRSLRKEIADARRVPPFVVFSDAALRDMARKRPRTDRAFLTVNGVGERKLADFGDRFLQRIEQYCREHELEDGPTGTATMQRRQRGAPSGATLRAFEMFAAGASIETVMTTLCRARSTTIGYLVRFIETRRPAGVESWVDEETYQRIAEAAAQFGTKRRRPIFELLDGQVSYDDIHIVTAHLNASAQLSPMPHKTSDV